MLVKELRTHRQVLLNVSMMVKPLLVPMANLYEAEEKAKITLLQCMYVGPVVFWISTHYHIVEKFEGENFRGF